MQTNLLKRLWNKKIQAKKKQKYKRSTQGLMFLIMRLFSKRLLKLKTKMHKVNIIYQM